MRGTLGFLACAAGFLALVSPTQADIGVGGANVGLGGLQVEVPGVTVPVPGVEVEVPDVGVQLGGSSSPADESEPSSHERPGNERPARTPNRPPTLPRGAIRRPARTRAAHLGSAPVPSPATRAEMIQAEAGTAPAAAVSRPTAARARTPPRRLRRLPPRVAAAVATRAENAKEESREPTLSTRAGDLIAEIPSGILIALVLMTVLGLLMTGRSAWFARATEKLRVQRHSLEQDVGVLQAALVPELPRSIGGTAVEAAYAPAGGPASGGDFHDVFELDDGRLGMVVGDISGHGREALPKTGIVRFTLRAYLEAGYEPRTAIRMADLALAGSFDGDFATAVAATWDPGTGRLVYSSAGNPKPIVVGSGTALGGRCSRSSPDRDRPRLRLPADHARARPGRRGLAVHRRPDRGA